MKILKCDRCGHLMPERKETVVSLGDMFTALGEVINDAVNLLTGKAQRYEIAKRDGEKIDLCPDCQKSLNNWMKYGKTLKKIKETIPPDEIIHNGQIYELKKEEKPAVNEISIEEEKT